MVMAELYQRIVSDPFGQYDLPGGANDFFAQMLGYGGGRDGFEDFLDGHGDWEDEEDEWQDDVRLPLAVMPSIVTFDAFVGW